MRPEKRKKIKGVILAFIFFVSFLSDILNLTEYFWTNLKDINSMLNIKIEKIKKMIIYFIISGPQTITRYLHNFDIIIYR